MDFKNRLRDLRAAMGLSQKELAEATHLSPSAIAMYESGKRLPKEEIKEILADFFNVSVDYLMGRDDTSMYFVEPKKMAILQALNAKPMLEECVVIVRFI